MNNGKKRKKTSHIGFCFFIVSIRCVSSKCVNSRPSEGSLELPGGRDRGEARGGTPYYGPLALGAAEAPRRPRICKDLCKRGPVSFSSHNTIWRRLMITNQIQRRHQRRTKNKGKEHGYLHERELHKPDFVFFQSNNTSQAA